MSGGTRSSGWPRLPEILGKAAAPALAYVHLEDVAQLSRSSRRLHDLLCDLGAGTTGAIRSASRWRYIGSEFRVKWWASALQVDEARKAMLKRQAAGRESTNVGLFERCAGLYDGTRSRRGGLCVHVKRAARWSHRRRARLSTRGTEGEIRRDVARESSLTARSREHRST